MVATSLDEFVDYLDALDGRAALEDLVSQLRRLRVECGDVADYLCFSERQYMRNLMKAGAWYNIVVLCWKNGQRSPIHDHLGSSCGVRVLRGVATETLFDFAPNGQVRAVSSRDLPAGSVCGSQDTDVHQVSNLQAGNADLVTLHVYSPPLQQMGTYSLTSPARGIEPMFLEFSEAGGI
ncbi:MAG: cysteine dioxygenase family protein [Gemmataceae bacterium]|nr:cysteine dioxygenase family protein [Gemmataceae bacterium]